MIINHLNEWQAIIFYQQHSLSHQMSRLILLTTIISSCLITVAAIPNPIYFPSPSAADCAATTSWVCPSYCTVTRTSSFTLKPQCVSGSSNFDFGGCINRCDQQFFVLNGTNCIPHLINNQKLGIYKNYLLPATTYTSGNFRLGFYNPSGISYNRVDYWDTLVDTVTLTDPHYAVRIRFSIYLEQNYDIHYQYPIIYSLDASPYTYDQTTKNYWSCNDIVTSPLHTHYNSTLVITWFNNNSSYPDTKNSAKCSLCYCDDCGTSSCGCVNSNCCQNKFAQINDLLVLVSICPSNCLTCYSATQCTSCKPKFILNYADKKCYAECPQATYENGTMYLLGNYTPTTTGSYKAQNQTYCVECNMTCLECLASNHCTRCYPSGRNQSYLFNNTCINPCINGYIANMTNHTCDCPELYHFQLLNMTNYTMYCYSCAFECTKCFERTNLNCTQCQKGFFLANGTTICLNQCPTGQYINFYTQTCYQCDVTCSSCVNNSTTCTQCLTNTPRWLLGSQCLPECPLGYSMNNKSRTCDLCPNYRYSYQGKCLVTCPKMYQVNTNNRSCIHLSQTDFAFSLVLEQIHVLQHGKLLHYTILAQDGLNSTSENWMKRYSYQMVQIIYGDSKLSDFVGIRTLQNATLTIRNLNYSNNRITYTTNLPDYIDYHKSFQVVFLNTLYSTQGIRYNESTNIYNINQHPQLIRQYYTYAAQNYCDLILIPFFIIFIFIFGLYLKGTYQMLIEAYRVVQLLGVLLYSAFPIGSFQFYFLTGCSYMNLDFVPNLYALLAKTDSTVNFASYFLGATDMDFIRLMGSILLFGIISLIVYVTCRFVFELKQSHLDYISKFCIDLMEVKIFHSFWSSLLYIISNYQKTDFSMFIIFIFAIVFLSAIIGRRYTIWKQTKDFSPFFVWRALSTLLVCLVSLANEIVISLLVVLSLAITLWQFFLLHSSKYLVKINSLNSSNYMQERTYKVLNDYDMQVQYSFSISFRNVIITVCPFLTSLLAGILILLKDEQFFVIVMSTVLIYLLACVAIVNSIFIYKFLNERRKFLVENTLQKLQERYKKLGMQDTEFVEQKQRAKIPVHSLNFDDEKYLGYGTVNKDMIKSFD